MTVMILSGWAGKTDWYRNGANPNIHVQVGNHKFTAVLNLQATKSWLILEETARVQICSKSGRAGQERRELTSEPPTRREILSFILAKT
ncbi:MAG: hypothetical protein IPJ47_02035 [Anaerolineales bacterium]|nr:hypothetical protein [Anaerolineales bacterium]